MPTLSRSKAGYWKKLALIFRFDELRRLATETAIFYSSFYLIKTSFGVCKGGNFFC
jgi:hypothetical protein